MVNGNAKGKRGERELVSFLREQGFTARRTQQYCGSSGDAADVVSADFPNVHFEVKRTEKLNLHAAVERACLEANGRLPIVCHKKNRKDWLAVMPLSQLIQILSESTYYYTPPDDGSI